MVHIPYGIFDPATLSSKAKTSLISNSIAQEWDGRPPNNDDKDYVVYFQWGIYHTIDGSADDSALVSVYGCHIQDFAPFPSWLVARFTTTRFSKTKRIRVRITPDEEHSFGQIWEYLDKGDT